MCSQMLFTTSDACASSSAAAVSMVAKIQDQPRCPSTEELATLESDSTTRQNPTPDTGKMGRIRDHLVT